jgi:hypothetical protein
MPRQVLQIARLGRIYTISAVTGHENCERRAKKPAPGRLKRLAPDVVCVV